MPLLPNTESLVTVEYIHEQERLGLDCTDPQADLGFVSAYATRVLLSWQDSIDFHWVVIFYLVDINN